MFLSVHELRGRLCAFSMIVNSLIPMCTTHPYIKPHSLLVYALFFFLTQQLVISQHNCPVGNVDLQGRIALHDAGRINLIFSCFLWKFKLQTLFLHPSAPVADACVFCSDRWDEMSGSPFLFFSTVMAGCSSSVKLLCDSGAAVNASDFVRIDSSHVLECSHVQWFELISVFSVPIVYWFSHLGHELLLCSFFCFQMRSRVWGTVGALLCVGVCRLI